MKNKLFMPLIIMLLIGVMFQFSCKKDVEPDEEAPTLSILSPTSDYSYLSESSTITISGTASDNKEIANIKWKDSHGNSGTALGTTEWTIRDVSLQNGDNVFTITAYDEADNSTSAEIMITYNKYLTFIGTPFVTPNSVFVNVSTSVNLSVTILANSNLDDNSVSLIEVDKNGNEIGEICQLFDDGNLSHGDEIKGDGVFCNITSFYRETPGDFYLRVKANTMESEGTVTAYSSICSFFVVDNINNETLQEIFNTQNAGDDKFRELSATLSKEEAISQTIEFLKTYSNVSSAVATASNDICITYSSGLKGMILTGGDNYKGGETSYGDRGNKSRIPLAKQTRGTYDENRAVVLSDPNILLDRDVIIYAPCYDQFVSWGAASEEVLYETLTESDCTQFQITYLKNGNADLDALKTLSNYGLIAIDTHGGLDDEENVIFLTGEEVSISNPHLIDWFMNRIYLVNKSQWAVKPSFISNYNHNLPNSIVYNGSCNSGHNATMANAFIGSGAQTYYGYSNSVKANFEFNTASQLFPRIITENRTTGDAFVANQHDNSNPPAYFVMFGNSNLRYQFGFVNGGFEEGYLNGFLTVGDGRVITQLGYITPYTGNFMGIISTGLGFTLEQGSISQTFCLPDNSNLNLSFKWNFLSEEFLEYVGSQYQDYFKVIVIDQNGVQNTLFSKSIDQIHESYELTSVSPEIVFDQGGVYGTGWLDLSLDLSAFAGQHITLVFAASDIGDSIYDTAILLDDITIE